jgi:flavin reductase (DIM6/NTAB) family NADH-FMN oxidoreductase RutF
VSSPVALDLFRRLDREVWIVTARGARDGGLVATSVVQASISPEFPRVVVGISKAHATWELIESSRAFALHLIPSERLDLVERFGMSSSRDIDKFNGLETHRGMTGAPLLAAACAWLECSVEATWDAGDRSFYLAEIIAEQVPEYLPPVLTMQKLVATAPPEMLRELRRQLEADAARDADRIREWRAAQH